MLICSQEFNQMPQGLISKKFTQEDDRIFLYIESMINLLATKEQYEIYFSFLLSFMDFKLEEFHVECYIHRVLNIIERQIGYFSFPVETLIKYIPLLYSKILYLGNLRYKYDITNFGSLWYDAGVHLLDISGLLIDINYNPKLYSIFNVSTRVSESKPMARMLKKSNTRNISEADNLRKERLPVNKNPRLSMPAVDDNVIEIRNIMPKITFQKTDIINNSHLKEVIWKSTLDCLNELININTNSLLLLEKQLAEEIIRKSQDLGIAIIEFSCETLVPNTDDLPDEELKLLVEIFNIGSTICNTLVSLNFKNFCIDILSKKCIDIFFDICQDDGNLISSGRKRIIKIAAPILIERSKEIIKNYLIDEKHSGLIPLSRYCFLYDKA